MIEQAPEAWKAQTELTRWAVVEGKGDRVIGLFKEEEAAYQWIKENRSKQMPWLIVAYVDLGILQNMLRRGEFKGDICLLREGWGIFPSHQWLASHYLESQPNSTHYHVCEIDEQLRGTT